ARLEHRGLGLDAFDEAALDVEEDDGDAAESNALLAGGGRVDDRGFAVGKPLTDPEARPGGGLEAGFAIAVEELDLKPSRTLLQRRGDRIVDERGEHAEEQRDDHCRHY